MDIYKHGNSYVMVTEVPFEEGMPHQWKMYKLTKGAGVTHRQVIYSFGLHPYEPCDSPPEHIKARAMAVIRAIEEAQGDD